MKLYHIQNKEKILNSKNKKQITKNLQLNALQISQYKSQKLMQLYIQKIDIK